MRLAPTTSIAALLVGAAFSLTACDRAERNAPAPEPAATPTPATEPAPSTETRRGVVPQPRETPAPAPADATAARAKYDFSQLYGTCEPGEGGSGRTYMGREISEVMGHFGVGWLERPEREREERTDWLIDALALRPTDAVADIELPEAPVVSVDPQLPVTPTTRSVGAARCTRWKAPVCWRAATLSGTT